MHDAITIVGLVYVALSLVIGGLSATIVLWKPELFTRNGPFRLPKTLLELVYFGLYMATLWPVLAMVAIINNRGAK